VQGWSTNSVSTLAMHGTKGCSIHVIRSPAYLRQLCGLLCNRCQ